MGHDVQTESLWLSVGFDNGRLVLVPGEEIPLALSGISCLVFCLKHILRYPALLWSLVVVCLIHAIRTDCHLELVWTLGSLAVDVYEWVAIWSAPGTRRHFSHWVRKSDRTLNMLIPKAIILSQKRFDEQSLDATSRDIMRQILRRNQSLPR